MSSPKMPTMFGFLSWACAAVAHARQTIRINALRRPPLPAVRVVWDGRLYNRSMQVTATHAPVHFAVGHLCIHAFGHFLPQYDVHRNAMRPISNPTSIVASATG